MYDIVVGRNIKDKEKFGSKGTIFLGKSFVKMGRTTSLSNNILLDVIRSHVIFVCGKRGGGKCLTGDSLITLENGLEIPIKNLETCNSNLFAMDEKFKIKGFKKNNFFKIGVILKYTAKNNFKVSYISEDPKYMIDGSLNSNSSYFGLSLAYVFTK